MKKTKLQYARLLIDILVANAFLDFIDFINDQEVTVRLQVEYEWKPIKCHHRRMNGHKDKECRKKTNVRKEWRRKPTQPVQERDEVEPSNINGN